MDSKVLNLATKEDVENTRVVLANTTRSLIRWMFFFWVLTLITYALFWLLLK